MRATKYAKSKSELKKRAISETDLRKIRAYDSMINAENKLVESALKTNGKANGKSKKSLSYETVILKPSTSTTSTPGPIVEEPDYNGLEELTKAYRDVLSVLGKYGYDIHHDENFAETAQRAAKAVTELIMPRDEILLRIGEMMEKVFPARYDNIVVQPNVFVASLCPHHLLPVMMRVTVGYIPNKHKIGISKIARIAKLFGKQPVMQEQYTNDLLELLEDGLEAKGVAVFVKGYHTCQSIRGACVHDVWTITNAISGAFVKPATRQEFFSIASSADRPML